jgi:hypothetical protein
MPVTTIAFHNLYDELNRDNRLFEERDAPIGDARRYWLKRAESPVRVSC